MAELEDSIFPSGSPRDGYDLRLEYVSTWESQFVGLGRLTAFLTPRLLSEAHGFDDMGLNVVFLQRHHVEVGLKLILERADADLVITHNIQTLRDACENACAAAGFDDAWGALIESQGEFIDLMDAADPEAANYRYPVDRQLRPLTRGLVDLRTLEQAGSEFQGATLALIDQLVSLEPLPVPEDEAAETAAELQALTHACQEMMRGARHNIDELRKQTQALGLLPGRSRGTHEADTALDAVEDVAESLATRSSRMLDRIAAAYPLQLKEAPARTSLRAIPALIPFRPSREMRKTQDHQIKALTDNIIATIRPLALATNNAYERSRDWSTPAAKQLHLDIARFRSRLTLAKVIEDE